MNDSSSRASSLPPSPREAASTRIATLEAELAAAPEGRGKAYLHLELGVIHEQALDDAAQAVRHYLAAFNQDAGLRPALDALVDIFERRRSLPNLVRLYKAEVKAATEAPELARAHVDLGLLRRSVESDAAKALEHVKHAFSLCPSDPYVALAAEYLSRVAGEPAGVVAALEARAATAGDPELAGLLAIDRAEALEAAGDVEGAAKALDEAVEETAARDRIFRAMERFARKHRHPELLVRALEGQAELAALEVRGGDSTGTGARRYASTAQAASAAVALLVEAARHRADALGDAAGAMLVMDQALAMRPDDVVLRLEHFAIASRAGEPAKAAAQARALAERFDVGPLRAALLSRVAEQAAAEGRAADAEKAFAEAATASGSASPFVEARIERDLRARGDEKAIVDRLLLAHDTSLDGRTAFEAAVHRAHGQGDFRAAEPLYRLAAKELEDGTPALRELYGAAVDLGGREDRVRAIEALLAQPLEDEERSTLWYELARLLEPRGEEGVRRLEVLALALDDAFAQGWAADLARVSAASTGSYALLAQAHSALAAGSEGETRAAHLAAAARASLLGGDPEAAVARLRELVQKAPGHRYGVALLEQVLRDLGRHEEAEAVLEEAAANPGGKGVDYGLMVAAARAESAGGLEAAKASYERAMGVAPDAASPAWGLYRLGQKAGRQDWSAAALARLAEQETADGEIRLGTLLHGEHLALAEGDAARALEALSAIAPDAPAAEAAAWLTLLLDPSKVDARDALAATASLAEGARGADEEVLSLELASAALAGELDVPAARKALEKLPRPSEDDERVEPRAAYARLRLAAADPAELDRPEAMIALGRATDEPSAQADFLLHGLRAAVAGGGENATDDAFLWAQQLAALGGDRLEAIVAQEETVGIGDDVDAYADAMEARLGRPANEQPVEVRAAAGRALAHAGRFPRAVSVLRAVVTEDPTDLASLDALRVAGRGAKDFAAVRDACDRLADAAPPALRALLLEESGIACMDALGDDQAARARFAAALAADPDRQVAYGRLHDLLVEADAQEELLALVDARIPRIDEGEELAKLYYEKARLLRSLGRLEQALEAIDNLLLLDAEHVGGIALSVEIHVTQGDYAAAVAALRDIASAQVPAQQKKVARLGAADFLEKKLGDAAGAIAELRAIDALGLADRALHLRVAALGEGASLWEDAVAGYERAAEGTGPDAAKHARRAAAIRLEHLGDAAGAEAWYRKALAADPLDLEAFRALDRLLGQGPAQVQVAEQLEAAVRERLAPERLDPALLRALRESAVVRGDKEFSYVVLSTIAAIGLATEDERKQLDENTAVIRKVRPSKALGDTLLARLRAPADAGPYAELAKLAYGALIEADSLEPSRYGVGRGELLGSRQPSKVRDELSDIAQAFGLSPGDFFVGGQRPTQIVVLPTKKGVVSFVIGARIGAPLDTPDRFHAGRQVAGAVACTLPLVNRAPSDAAALLFAAAAAAGVPLPAGEGRAGVADWTRALDKGMSRKARNAIREWAPTVRDGGAGIIDYCRAARATALRAGLLISADLYGTLKLLLGGEPSWSSVVESVDARELVCFWLSRPVLALRRELGVTP